ncbi:MAG TPA: type II secretion system protein [Candidatus Saccharimonadia bacterium]|nr:type II secretion system protein [Candidatus Saccharimonadia bacterium]
MKNVSLKNTVAKGFSLVEMLVVIAVIGVIAAIAIPQIGSINSSAKEAKNQRNAQSIVSVYSAATAAGATVAGATAAAKVDALVTGVVPTEGAFKDKSFKVPNMEAEDKTGALKYIKLDGTDLVYTKVSQ